MDLQKRKINVYFLDALAVSLTRLEGFHLATAMIITMIEGGEDVRDATQGIAQLPSLMLSQFFSLMSV
jgi:P-type Cu2+ transporter